MSAGPLCPAPFGIAEGSGHASAEPPRRKRARRASGGAAGEGTAGAPGGRLREGASASERRKLHNPRSSGCGSFRVGAREGAVAALKSAALRECEGRCAGAPSCFRAQRGNGLGRRQGAAGPERPRRQPRSAHRARRARAPVRARDRATRGEKRNPGDLSRVSGVLCDLD